MVYIYKEYEHIFDTPYKKQQETAIVSKIMELLNKNKYDNLYDFISKNSTYQDFLKKNNMENVIKHFGNSLTEQDYIKIQDQLVKLTEKKSKFERENIKTTNIGDNEYNSFVGNDRKYFLDNSNSNKSIERQMEDLQKTETKFQTSDTRKNTENMMKELETNKKESLNLRYLKDIDVNMLNHIQREVFWAASNYQLNTPKPIMIDVDKKIIVDESNNILQIQKKDDKYVFVGDDNTMTKSSGQEKQQRTLQKSLVQNYDSIYNN